MFSIDKYIFSDNINNIGHDIYRHDTGCNSQKRGLPMGKVLPVSVGSTPYRYVLANLSAVGEEFLTEAEGLAEGDAETKFRLRRLLTVYEVLGALRDGFRANGWCGESEGEKETRVIFRSGVW